MLAAAICVAGALLGAVNGVIVVFSRVPDVVVTLTTGFIWVGWPFLFRGRAVALRKNSFNWALAFW